MPDTAAQTAAQEAGDAPAQPRWAVEAASGAALGLLVGLLLGLSVSEVVGGAVAALTALLGAFFGVADGKLGGLRAVSSARAARLIGFCLLCALGVGGGVHLRATGALGPSAQAQLQGWEALGVAPERARDLVIYQRLGLLPEGAQAGPGADAAARAGGGGLFAGDVGAACGRLTAPVYADAAALESALRDEGGAWADYADALPPGLAPAQRLAAMRAAVGLVCG